MLNILMSCHKGPEPLQIAHKKKSERKTNPELDVQKKPNATMVQWIEILNWFQNNGKSQSKTTKHFDEVYSKLLIKQPLISAWVKDEPRWYEEVKHNLGTNA